MKAKWITATPSSTDTSLYVFKKSFIVDDMCKSFIVRVSADTRYKLFINGQELAHGPCHSSEFVKYYEELECGTSLITGENEICVQVFHARRLEHFGTMFRKDKPALYLEGVLTYENRVVEIGSDESFWVARVKNISYEKRVNMMPSLAPCEDVHGDTEYEVLTCTELYVPNTEWGYYSSWGVKDMYRLDKRPIQILVAKDAKEIPVVREYIGDDGKYNIILDAGIYTTAMLNYKYLAPKGTMLKLIYAECALTRAEDGTLYKYMRDNIDGVIEAAIYDVLTASGKEQTHAPFYYRTFRYIRVECSQKPEYFIAYAARYTYDYEKEAIEGGVGSFACSNEAYMKLWDISRNTLECSTHEIFVDCPYHEQQQYVGDARYESEYAWRFSNDSAMQKKVLVDTVHSQQEDGQVLGNYPNTLQQIIHQCSLLFVLLLRNYLRYTGDIDFVRGMIGVCDRVFDYFEGAKNTDGLTVPKEGCKFIDWVDTWQAGFPGIPEGGDTEPLTFINLMYAKTLNDAAEICDACGRKGLASEYRERSAKLRAIVNALCYDEEMGLYVDVPGRKTYSQHVNLWAVLADAVTGEAARDLIDRAMSSDFVAKCSFSKNYDLLRAFEKAGCYEKYAKGILYQWEEMLNKHCTTWCEDPVTERSECHGWSCVPAYEFSAKILGVYPVEDGFKKIRIQPVPLDLTFAKGRVPTSFGYVDVCWKKDKDGFSIELTSNRQVEMEIVCPGGKKETVFADHYVIRE